MEPISFCVEICLELILVIIGIVAVLIIAPLLIFVGFYIFDIWRGVTE